MKTQEQIKELLAQLYCQFYDRYEQLELLAKEAVQDGDRAAFNALHRRATGESQILFGIQQSAQALGIQQEEFRAATAKNTENGGQDDAADEIEP